MEKFFTALAIFCASTLAQSTALSDQPPTLKLNAVNNTAGAFGFGGAGGQGGAGGSSSAIGGTSTAAGGTGGNATQSTAVQTQTTVTTTAPSMPASSAYGPTVQPTAVCALSLSGGAQGALFGLSLGGSYVDANCVLLEQVRAAQAIGAREVAMEMMMDVPAYANAVKRIAERGNK